MGRTCYLTTDNAEIQLIIKYFRPYEQAGPTPSYFWQLLPGGIRENTHEVIFEENINLNERYVVLCTVVTEGTQRHPTN